MSDLVSRHCFNVRSNLLIPCLELTGKHRVVCQCVRKYKSRDGNSVRLSTALGDLQLRPLSQ